MANIFETVILNMRDAGFFQFLFPFMLSTAMFFGLLRKSKIFGDPREVLSINAVVALVASFMVWSAPILLGINMEEKLATFFVQGVTATLVVLVGLLIASMFFPPDMAGHISTILKTPRYVSAFLIFGILVGAGIFLSSGLINIFLPEGIRFTGAEISEELVTSILAVVLLLGTVLIIVWGGGGGGGGSTQS